MTVPLALFACGDDDDDDAADTTTAAVAPTAATAAAGSVPTAITVTATDYRFDGLPATAPAGTAFALQNDSENEVHEMVVIRIPDEEQRSVGELLALPEDELDAAVGAGPPALVIVALPGEAGSPVLGDGTLAEAGRYAVLCFIPVGADPEEARTAMSDPEATGVPGSGPPHIAEGMYAEITIE